jgi:uncharacterized protein (TIGR03435 family)
MKRTLLFMSLAAFTAVHDHCQELGKSPAFEVASITACKPGTPAPPGEHAGMVQFTYPGGRFEARATTVKFLVEWAYGILPAQHSSVPSWMEDERWDIVAKAAGPASDAEMKRMAQRLLADRFHLQLHHEMRDVPVLIMMPGKTAPKLFPAKDGETHSMKIAPQMGEDQKIISYRVTATKFSFAQLNEVFSRQLDRVLVNQTGIDGDVDFALDLTPDETRPNPLDPSLIISAMRDQLGLTLKSEKGQAEFLVIDGGERAAAN